jgi:two-component system, response regulator PdtaR
MVEQAGLAPMRVCIFSPEPALRESLVVNSSASGYSVEASFSEPRKLVDFVTSSSVDHIVILDLREQLEKRLHLIKELSAKRPVPIVGVAGEENSASGECVIEAGAQALLSEPIRAQDVRAALTIAAHQQAKQAGFEREIALLRERLADRKLIEKAKGILMDSAKVSEAEAFRIIQKQSQDKRKPMAEIATLIISASELVSQAASARAD